MTYDLVVVGGGLIGAAIAWGASRTGASVALLDEGDVAYRASRGNFGLIWLQGKGVGKPAYMHWSLRAGRLWKDLAGELHAATGLDTGWRQTGGLHFCFSEAELDKRRDVLARTQADGGEITMQFLDRTALRDLVPGIGPEVVGASFSPEDFMSARSTCCALCSRPCRMTAAATGRAPPSPKSAQKPAALLWRRRPGRSMAVASSSPPGSAPRGSRRSSACPCR